MGAAISAQFAAWIGLTICATIGSATISPKRTYYPVLKVLFGFIAFAGAYYTFTSAAYYRWPWLVVHPFARMVGVVALLGAVAWAVLFVWRRNREPQYLVLDVRGIPESVDMRALETKVLDAASAVRHDAVSEATARLLAEALVERKRKRRQERGGDSGTR